MNILNILWTHIPELALLTICLVGIVYGIAEFFVEKR